MISSPDLPTRLQSEFGHAVPLSQASAIDGVVAQCTAAPRDEEAAQKLVHWCGQNNVAFVARGGGTKLHLGARPSRCDLIISTEHLNRIVEHDEGNATVQAESGVALETLQSAVAQKRQFVPLDWNEQEFSTLGGVVATNHFGATKLRYGSPRDLVVGLHAVLSDGRLVKAGSKVVKNVSGYDLNKLFIGSFGTLGLISQVTIRLRPDDAIRKYWEKQFASWEEAEHTAQKILNGAFEPAILRVVAQGGKYLLWARFDGSEAAVSAQLERLPQTESTVSEETPAQTEISLRATLPLARAASWAQAAQQSGATRVLWDCGLGVVHAEWEHAPQNAVQLVQQLREAALRAEGFLVVERAPAEWKTSEFVWGEKRSDFALMQGLKSTLDSASVCVPGRFVGGI